MSKEIETIDLDLICKSCEAPNDPDELFCSECGLKRKDKMFKSKVLYDTQTLKMEESLDKYLNDGYKIEKMSCTESGMVVVLIKSW